MAVVTLGAFFPLFISIQRSNNVVVCDRSSCSHTTLLQGFVPWAIVFIDYSIQNNGINKVTT